MHLPITTNPEAPPPYEELPIPLPLPLGPAPLGEERAREEQEREGHAPEYDFRDEGKGLPAATEKGKEREKEEEQGPVASTSQVRDRSIFSGGEPSCFESKTAPGSGSDVIVIDLKTGEIGYSLLYPNITFYGNWTHATLHTSHYPPGPEIGRIDKVYGSNAKKWVRIRGKPETLLEQQGVFGLKTSSSHAFLGAEGAKYLWRKQSSSTPLSWELIKKGPKKEEQVVSVWKVWSRCEGGDGRFCRIQINRDFESEKELILSTGLAVLQWALKSDSAFKTALNDYLS